MNQSLLVTRKGVHVTMLKYSKLEDGMLGKYLEKLLMYLGPFSYPAYNIALHTIHRTDTRRDLNLDNTDRRCKDSVHTYCYLSNKNT